MITPLLALLYLNFLGSPLKAGARQWHDTGKGSIVLEEAWTTPELIGQSSDAAAPFGGTVAAFLANMVDIHNQRIAFMDKHGVDYMVISCATPCIQGVSDPVEAAEMAVDINNRLAASISNNTARFGGFAALAMHNATVAAQELKRTVKELGFLGALINDYQQSGPDNATLLFYDQPEYDVFWKMVTELDVPVYLHPRHNIAQITNLAYAHSPYIEGPGQEYAATLSSHILGLCANGVFDRFPSLKVIVGHMGERIPSDLFRIDEQLARQLSKGMPMLRNASSYWQTNLFETTAGTFSNSLLKFHIGEIGIDRIMYSVDYPFVLISEGAKWLDGLDGALHQDDLFALKRGNAIKLLGLDK